LPGAEAARAAFGGAQAVGGIPWQGDAWSFRHLGRLGDAVDPVGLGGDHLPAGGKLTGQRGHVRRRVDAEQGQVFKAGHHIRAGLPGHGLGAGGIGAGRAARGERYQHLARHKLGGRRSRRVLRNRRRCRQRRERYGQDQGSAKQVQGFHQVSPFANGERFGSVIDANTKHASIQAGEKALTRIRAE